MAVQAMLQSWKEISRYVGRTERTLQRWEQEFGFPVHRPSGKSRSAVMALTREINEWARGKPSLALIRQTARIKRAKFVVHPANQSASKSPPRKTSSVNGRVPRTRHSGFAEPLLESAGERQRFTNVLCETERKMQVLKRLLRQQQSLYQMLEQTGQRRFFN